MRASIKPGAIQYGEEAAAEVYATGNLGSGLAFPILAEYVTTAGLAVETLGVAAVVGAAACGIHEVTR
jgi:hypothetical protein